jgi:hypothetical protein
MRTFATWGSIACLSLIIVLGGYTGCSQEAAFTPPVDMNTSERFRSATYTAVDSDWSNSGQSAGPGYLSERFVVCNWEGYLSRGFIRFTAFPDTEVTVDSVLLYLYVTRIESDGGAVTFDIHSLTDTLEQTEIYWGTMPGISAAPVASFSGPMESGDSVFVDITELAEAWRHGTEVNYGLAIKIDENTGAPQAIAEFGTKEVLLKVVDDSTIYDFRPALRFAYVDTGGEQQHAIAITSEDVFADTLITPFQPDTSSVLCGNGFPSRGFIRFDLSDIPGGSTLARSTLFVSPDLERSSFDSMGVQCHAVLDADWSGHETSIGASGTGLATLIRTELSGDEMVEMDVTAILQDVIAGTQDNYGLALRSSDERFDLDFVRFFSHSQPDTDLVPMLKVEYVLPPDLPSEIPDQEGE